MSEIATEPAPAATAAAEAPKAPSIEEFNQVKEQLSNINTALAAERAAKKAAEDAAAAAAQKTEAGKATVTSLQEQLNSLTSELSTEKKKGFVTPLLAEAHDPTDALAFLKLDEIEDSTSAKAQVEGLKKVKPYLFKQKVAGNAGAGAPQVGSRSAGADEENKGRLARLFGLPNE